MLRPPFSAHSDAPLPRWATMTRPSATFGAAVSDAQVVAQPCAGNGQRRRHVTNGIDAEGALDHGSAMCIRRFELWSRADAVHLPLDAALQITVGRDVEQLELDARRTGIDDEDGI